MQKDRDYSKKIVQPKIALQFFIAGGILLTVNSMFLANKVVFNYSILRLDIMIWLYLVSVCTYVALTRQLNSMVTKFTFFYIMYFIFIASLIELTSNLLFLAFKSKTSKFYDTELLYTFKGTLKTTKQISFKLDEILYTMPVHRDEIVGAKTRINLEYAESLFGSKIIERFYLY
jgi:hypothetical protein